jgi:hypothetical protein
MSGSNFLVRSFLIGWFFVILLSYHQKGVYKLC